MSTRFIYGDCRDILPTLAAGSVQCCVTSPPYFGLRDYGVETQIGLEATPEKYIAEIVAVFREVRRVLRDDATLWLNLGDSYAMATRGAGGDGKQHTNAGSIIADRRWVIPPNCKQKDLLMIPAQVALALRADGWYLRSDIIWHKPNPMPESIRDRPTSAHEHVFLLSKSERYFYDADAISEPAIYKVLTDRKPSGAYSEGSGRNDGGFHRSGGFVTGETRNARNVWTVTTKPFKGAHFATMPPDLVERCVKAGSAPGSIVLDPFGGAGTTAMVADRLGRDAVSIDLSQSYALLAKNRLLDDAGMFAAVAP